MDRQSPSSYENVKPAGGRDESELDPFEIEFRPEHRGNRGPREPFVNEHGIVVGDHDYASPDSPLEQWSKDTDPAIMAGAQWVHPYKDIGFRTRENWDLFEKGVAPASSPFMHPTHATASIGGVDDEDYFPVPEVLDEP